MVRIIGFMATISLELLKLTRKINKIQMFSTNEEDMWK